MRRGYKRTGVLTVDKVAGCIYHYEQQGRPLESVTLDEQHWAIFEGFANKYFKGCVNEDNTVDFDGVIVRKGSRLMSKDMYWDFKKTIEA